MIDLLHLKTFCTITDTHSFTAAARHLGCSQPTVTTHIRALEAALGGARLFQREKFCKFLVLTETGRRTLRFSKMLLALAERAPVEVQSDGG